MGAGRTPRKKRFESLPDRYEHGEFSQNPDRAHVVQISLISNGGSSLASVGHAKSRITPTRSPGARRLYADIGSRSSAATSASAAARTVAKGTPARSPISSSE